MKFELESDNFLAKKLDSQATRQSSELVVIKNCLKTALRAFNIYFDRQKTESKYQAQFLHGHYMPSLEEEYPEKDIISDALFRDAVIQFMMCFNTKEAKRHEFLISKEVFGEMDNWEAFYTSLHSYRDAYAAHKFGAQRQIEITGFFDRESKKFVELASVSLTFPEPHEISKEEIVLLCEKSISHVVERLSILEAAIRVEASAYSAAEVDKLEPSGIAAPNQNEIRMSREKFATKSRFSPQL